MREAHAFAAAAVASQLQAFVKEPARYRPGYIHGREPLPDGATVLRIAQGKHPELQARDAAAAFIRQVCFWEGATHYQLLCAAPEAKRETLKENYHHLMALIHPDRREAGAEPWPAGCVPRVNHAYAVVSDGPARRDYDAGLRLLASGEFFTPEALTETSAPARRKRQSRLGLRFAKALVVVAVVAGTLLLLEAWVGDVSGNYSAFHGRTLSAVAGKELPRFLGLWREPVRQVPSFEPPDGVVAPPPPPVRAEPPRVVASIPDPEPPRALPTVPVELKPAAAIAIVQAPAAVPPEAPPAPARDPAVTQAIELMVARLVGAYEAGETEKVMELLDASEAGFWRTARTRQAYGDFFRATKQRTLRVNNLAWRTDDGTAHAKGDATLVAEYFDTPGTTERRVDVELDIRVRGGQARITRLSLFPNAP